MIFDKRWIDSIFSKYFKIKQKSDCLFSGRNCFTFCIQRIQHLRFKKFKAVKKAVKNNFKSTSQFDENKSKTFALNNFINLHEKVCCDLISFINISKLISLVDITMKAIFMGAGRLLGLGWDKLLLCSNKFDLLSIDIKIKEEKIRTSFSNFRIFQCTRSLQMFHLCSIFYVNTHLKL